MNIEDQAVQRALSLYIDERERPDAVRWERFAAMALAGFCASPQTVDMQSDEHRAERAALTGDAMLAEFKKRFP